MGTDDRTYGATDKDKDMDWDTEGHDWRRTYPLPPNVEGGGSQPSDFIREGGDTEGHGEPRPGGEAHGSKPPEGAAPRHPEPGEHAVDDDTEGHYQLRRRPGDGGE